MDKLNRRRGIAVVVNTAQAPCRVLLDPIRYVEQVGRNMGYHCTEGIVNSQTIRASFREMATPRLADPRFPLCGSSFARRIPKEHIRQSRKQATGNAGGLLPASFQLLGNPLTIQLRSCWT